MGQCCSGGGAKALLDNDTCVVGVPLPIIIQPLEVRKRSRFSGFENWKRNEKYEIFDGGRVRRSFPAITPIENESISIQLMEYRSPREAVIYVKDEHHKSYEVGVAIRDSRRLASHFAHLNKKYGIDFTEVYDFASSILDEENGVIEYQTNTR